MDVTFATPLAALGGLAGVVPLTVALLRMRTARRLRRELGLDGPSAVARLTRPLALACVFGLLGLAAAQPSIRRQHERLARTDAELLVVLDSSRSMLAAAGPAGQPRYRRAVAFAHRLHAAFPQVPVGVSSLTNRLLPYVFPTSDTRTFDLVLDKVYGVERPPPALASDSWVTTFQPLNEVVVRHFFSPTVHKRVLVVLSDAETRPFDARVVLRHLRRADTMPVVVRFWRPDERIFTNGVTSESYRSTEPGALTRLHAAGWPAYRESDFGTVAGLVRRSIGSGPVARVGYERRDTPIAPMVALAALAPLLLLLAPGGRLPPARRLVRRLRGGAQVAQGTLTARASS
jgi:hypothetical protein